ncbi:MAG: hypothetical protein K0U16_07385 [Gammaproteobacteria bacterium]|nr:hypothetical protein [Gammaproteobacteria bacterium]
MTWKLNKSQKGPWLLLIGPYDEDFVQELKDLVPPEDREWRDVTKAWRIADHWEPQVRELIARWS